MFGWEFPPAYSGGLGIACYGLTRQLAAQGAQVTFVLPKKMDSPHNFLKVISCGDEMKGVKTHILINSALQPYMSEGTYISNSHDQGTNSGRVYGSSIYEEVLRYGEVARTIAATEEFDVIHAHDWLSTKAAIAAKEVSGKPMVLHIHNTVYDRGAGNPCPEEYEIEREGMHKADKIITVSQWTKNKVVEHYDIPASKVEVVHNGIDFDDYDAVEMISHLKKTNKIVLFLGRITIQKGPDYFIDAAKKVLEKEKDVMFVFSGSGDMERQMIEKAASLGISDRVLFAGFTRGKERDKMYQMADVFVMPSVSEPFGLVPLEAMYYGTPCVISKQSGVAEVTKHCFKVDFWDINEMANKIVSLLRYPPLHDEMVSNGKREVKTLTWEKAASKCINIYNELLCKV